MPEALLLHARRLAAWVCVQAEPSALDILLARAFARMLRLVGGGVRFDIRNAFCKRGAVHGGLRSLGLRRRTCVVACGIP